MSPERRPSRCHAGLLRMVYRSGCKSPAERSTNPRFSAPPTPTNRIPACSTAAARCRSPQFAKQFFVLVGNCVPGITFLCSSLCAGAQGFAQGGIVEGTSHLLCQRLLVAEE